jgi:hypothetical protein
MTSKDLVEGGILFNSIEKELIYATENVANNIKISLKYLKSGEIHEEF